MKSQKIAFKTERSDYIEQVLKDEDFLLSIIPYQVERGKNFITLRVTRLGLFSFKDKFYVENKSTTKNMVIYSFTSEHGNKFEIFISFHDIESNSLLIDMAIKYEGEKEWIVGKYLEDILKSLKAGIEKEMKKARDTIITADYSVNLSKLSFITKLLMKSRIIDNEEVEISRGQLIEVMSRLIQSALKYRLIYVSGNSTDTTFRLLFIDGDLKGVYVNLKGDERTDENALNEVEGNFKVNIYVSLMPEEIMKAARNEGS